MNNLLQLLPPFERSSKVFQEIMKAEQIEFDKLAIDIEDLEKQLNIDTATWGLEIYERELGIKTVELSTFDVYTTSYFLQPTMILEEHEDVKKPLEDRRSVIKSKWRGTGKVDRALIKVVVDAFTNGGVDVSFDGRIIVTFNDVKGIPPNLEDAQVAVENICPAHLAVIYQFAYLLIKEIHEVKTLAEIEQIPLHKFAGGSS